MDHGDLFLITDIRVVLELLMNPVQFGIHLVEQLAPFAGGLVRRFDNVDASLFHTSSALIDSRDVQIVFERSNQRQSDIFGQLGQFFLGT